MKPRLPLAAASFSKRVSSIESRIRVDISSRGASWRQHHLWVNSLKRRSVTRMDVDESNQRHCDAVVHKMDCKQVSRREVSGVGARFSVDMNPTHPTRAEHETKVHPSTHHTCRPACLVVCSLCCGCGHICIHTLFISGFTWTTT